MEDISCEKEADIPGGEVQFPLGSADIGGPIPSLGEWTHFVELLVDVPVLTTICTLPTSALEETRLLLRPWNPPHS